MVLDDGDDQGVDALTHWLKLRRANDTLRMACGLAMSGLRHGTLCGLFYELSLSL